MIDRSDVLCYSKKPIHKRQSENRPLIETRRRQWRIPEATLLLVSALFGSLGAYLGMLLFRHKTNAKRHPAFAVGVPVMLIVQAALVYWLLRSCQLVP